jgi:hypothetical protein
MRERHRVAAATLVTLSHEPGQHRKSKKKRLAYQSQLEEDQEDVDEGPRAFGPDRVDDDGGSLDGIG